MPTDQARRVYPTHEHYAALRIIYTMRRRLRVDGDTAVQKGIGGPTIKAGSGDDTGKVTAKLGKLRQRSLP